MGQRSQIYIRIIDEDNNKILIAKYFQWNFAERMISRARHGIEYIKDNLKYINQDSVQEKISKIFDVNFDMQSVVSSTDILQEVREQFWENKKLMNDYIFQCQDNNDGKLFIDCDQKSGEVKFCFTDYDLNILTPKEYMNWDGVKGWEKEFPYCKENINYINENAKLMTDTELEEFMQYDYSKQIGESCFKKCLKEFVEKQMAYNEYWWFRFEKTDDNGSWKIIGKNTKELCFQYDNNTKKLSINPNFKYKDLYEGIVQDIYDYYNIPYENDTKNSNDKEQIDVSISEDSSTKISENFSKKDSDIDYDYE